MTENTAQPLQPSRLTLKEITEPALSGNGNARSCELHTRDGIIETPIFMPVGTQGTVKGVLTRDLKEMGAQIILGNTYHLWLRPGPKIMRDQGGLKKWMNWNGPILTDSGGFQVFSLSDLRKIKEEGVEFKSHIDGAKVFLTPELSIEVQEAIGSTIMMVLDVCPALPATPETLNHAVEQSTRWAKRCLKARRPDAGALFAIVQGGLNPKLRLEHLETLSQIQETDSEGHLNEFDGYALGGFSVGESPTDMVNVLKQVTHQMPRSKPRYLMGVGTPQDLLNAIETGIDMFDCVMPTRNARNASLFTSRGAIKVKNSKWANSSEPVDPNCTCHTCQNYSLSYLRHLHQCHEILAAVLGSIHNLHYYLHLMKQSRIAIRENRFLEFKKSVETGWVSEDVEKNLEG